MKYSNIEKDKEHFNVDTHEKLYLRLTAGSNWILPYIKEYLTKHNLTFKKGLEMGAGEGHLGLELLEEGFYETMDFTDINPLSEKYITKEIKDRGLEDKCRVFIGDTFENVPDTDYDNVICNPPHYQQPIQQAHSKEVGMGYMPFVASVDEDWKFRESIFKDLNQYAKSFITLESVWGSSVQVLEYLMQDNQEIHHYEVLNKMWWVAHIKTI